MVNLGWSKVDMPKQRTSKIKSQNVYYRLICENFSPQKLLAIRIYIHANDLLTNDRDDSRPSSHKRFLCTAAYDIE